MPGNQFEVGSLGTRFEICVDPRKKRKRQDANRGNEVRQIDNRVKDSMTRATDMMHFFHGEMSSNFEDLPITTR